METDEPLAGPTVTVVISTYNRQDRIRRAMESVLSQTFQDFELIVVDDRSTDRTREVVQSFHDPRLRYVCHEANKGGPAARNTGIKLAKGRYIALLDDDDEWLPLKLEKQVRKMRESPACTGVIYVGSEIYDERQKRVVKIYEPRYRGNVYQRLLLSTILSSVGNVLVRKECFDEVGLFDEELSSCQDWDMWLRIAARFEFDFVPEILIRINIHGEHISTNYAAMIPGRTRMIQKHWDEFKIYPSILVIHLKRLGKMHFINGTWREGVGWFKKALKIDFFEIVKILAWCIVELPVAKFFSEAKHFKRYKPG
jgi:glycosyltransferase involved in cell wall biosynthesis